MEEILTRAAEETFPKRRRGERERRAFLPAYAAALVEKVRTATGEREPLKGKRILVDAGNGAGGFYADEVLVPLGADTTGSQYLDPDGMFPGHIPNPENEEAMRLGLRSREENEADFGIIFDTDVDRAGAPTVDKKRRRDQPQPADRPHLGDSARGKAGHHRHRLGHERRPDEIHREPGRKALPLQARVQKRHRRAVRRNAAGEYTPLAIETSGHAALKENYFLDDGAYLVTRLLIALAKEGRAGGELTDLIKDPARAERGERGARPL